MANLAQVNYLHSQKWTFFNQAGKFAVNSPIVFDTKLKELKSDLQKEMNLALGREQAFYNDFGVQNNVEWARKYLVNVDEVNNSGEDSSREGTVLKVLKSPKMIKILSSDVNSNQDLIRAFEKDFNQIADGIVNNDLLNEITKEFDNAILNGTSFEQFFIELLGFRSEKSKITSNTKRKALQRAIWDTMSKDIKPKLKKTGRVYSEKSEYFRPYKQHLNQLIAKTGEQRIQDALQTFQQELKKTSYFKSHPTEIKTYVDALEFALNEDLNSNEQRWVATIKNTVSGESLEGGIIISQIDFSNPFEYDSKGRITKIRSKVVSQGKNTTKRYGAKGEVKSKTDLLWESPNHKGKFYRMQAKHSINAIYDDYEVLSQIENLPNDKMSEFGLQSNEIQLKNLMQGFSAARVLPQETIEFLTYLIVNLNVLNNDWANVEANTETHRLYKGANNGPNIDNAQKTQELIDSLLTNGIKYFISDFPEADSGDFTKMESYDFVIFRGETLIPISLFYKKMLELLETHSTTMDRIYSTSATKFSKSEYENMNEEKREAREEEEATTPKGKNIVYNYHLQSLVDAGSRAGEIALEKTYIKKVAFKFNYKNLIMKGLG